MCDNCGCGMKAEKIQSMPMFNTDSINTLGVETEESAMHESSEPKGSMGEDID